MVWGRRLDILGKRMKFNILSYRLVKIGPRTKYPYRSFLKSHLQQQKKIWLRHYFLGHPSFGVLKIMFPLLFKGIDVERLHCDVCELAKQHCTSYPISNKRVSIPFTMEI